MVARRGWTFLERLDEVVWSLEENPLLYMDTMMRYFLHVNPDELSDEEWLITYNQLSDIREKEAEANG
jgi:hypothetical protein